VGEGRVVVVSERVRRWLGFDAWDTEAFGVTPSCKLLELDTCVISSCRVKGSD
jgi:hypothetical protein